MSSRLLVVSNRLPIVLNKTDSGWVSQPGSGGLITALTPVLKQRGGLWIGWPGATGDDDLTDTLTQAGQDAGFNFAPVAMTEKERDDFYYGFSNEIIWPLFHDLHMRCNYDPAYWDAYRTVNRKFAQAIKENLQEDDFIWVHDYHLMHVAKELREAGVQQRIGFFLHIPFPPPEIFLKLPWRFDVLQALLEFDVLGFQTQGYRHSFTQCIRSVMPGFSVRGHGRIVTTKTPQRDVQIGVFPISIDFDEFANHAASEEVTQLTQLVYDSYPDTRIVLGVDRLDYTKGIPERLRAFGRALERFPDMREKVTLVQVVVPSRTAIDEYQDLKSEIEQLVGKINGQFTASGWVPIHYIFRSLDRANLLSFYRAADIMAVTPLRDGMNLVAKEYCACRTDNDGVLILSEFAGTAAAMHRGALLVNPHDREGMAESFYHAYLMEEEEQRIRMSGLRQQIHTHDVFWWLEMFLSASSGVAVELAAPAEEHDLMAILPPTAFSSSIAPRVPDPTP